MPRVPPLVHPPAHPIRRCTTFAANATVWRPSELSSGARLGELGHGEMERVGQWRQWWWRSWRSWRGQCPRSKPDKTQRDKEKNGRNTAAAVRPHQFVRLLRSYSDSSRCRPFTFSVGRLDAGLLAFLRSAAVFGEVLTLLIFSQPCMVVECDGENLRRWASESPQW